MHVRNALLAATFLALPLAAQAQPISGLYVGAGVGVNMLQESDVELSRGMGATVAARSGSAEFDYGLATVLSVGYGYGNGLRAELEGSFRQNDVDSFTGAGVARPIRSLGQASSYGLMLNALYDFSFPNAPIIPYVGVGVGYQWVDYSGVRGAGSNGTVILDGTDGQFAYQAIVGGAFPVAEFPGLAVTAEYRFMGTLSPEMDARSGVTNTRGTAEVDNFNHSLLIGLRYAFGVVPPPPVVAPQAPVAQAPEIARTYLVFFDFDRADLTDRARQIIGEAATNSQRAGVTRIEVSGHADRAGTPQYNQRLSERRAAAVASELERRGVPRAAMAIQAFGESRPLVPTADGVREPQNRRVEIVLR
ncbi:OmpA family protein [Falsiroseomonas sp. E2-1-a20]|uniref:OmpA family protein n=1 Tax=Falsiroseomonas sp. E2-1-a20 TaxID=3239300 RepID=UPI003F2FCF44